MSKNENPLFSIQSLIDGMLQASSLPCGIEVPDITLIATANDLTCIPMALISRFEIVAVEGYTYREKLKIAKEFTIPKLLCDYNAENLSITSAAVKKILSYSEEPGIRDAKNNATTLVILVASPSKPSVKFTALTVPVTTNKISTIYSHQGIEIVVFTNGTIISLSRFPVPFKTNM